MTPFDLLGRFLGGETTRMEGPSTQAIRDRAICYPNEIVKVRSDAVVGPNLVAEHRRGLSLQALSGVTIKAAAGVQLFVCYKRGYQSISKDMKPSTRVDANRAPRHRIKRDSARTKRRPALAPSPTIRNCEIAEDRCASACKRTSRLRTIGAALP